MIDCIAETLTLPGNVQLEEFVGILQVIEVAAQTPLVTMPTVTVQDREPLEPETLNVPPVNVVPVPGVNVFAVLVPDPVEDGVSSP